MRYIPAVLAAIALSLAIFGQSEPEPTLDSQAEMIRELTDRVRVLEFQLATVYAQLEEKRALPEPAAHSYWFGYKSATLMGAFDVRDINSWEGSKLRSDGPWNYKLYSRWTSRVVALDQQQFDAFAPKFDKYLKNSP